MNSKIISLLADGSFHSGVELGQRLGITRAAVWKIISQLEQIGLQTESVKGVGYRLTEPLSLLSYSTIIGKADASVKHLIESLAIKASLESTNDYVKAYMESQQGYMICLAEHQSAGRGRRGKSWISPYGKNLCMSIGFRFERGFEALNGLSLVVGIAVARSIADLGLAAKLKWPNDVWIEKKKVAGILVEVDGEQGGPLNLIVGLGVNVNMKPCDAEIDQPWTSLATELSKEVDRSALAASLITNLLILMEQFKQRGFVGMKEEWKKFDGVSGSRVTLANQDQEEQGICRGVDHRGYLLLESDGKVQAFSGGELSLRIAS